MRVKRWRYGGLGCFFALAVVMGGLGCRQNASSSSEDRLKPLRPLLLSGSGQGGAGAASARQPRPRPPSGGALFSFANNMEGWRGWGGCEGRRDPRLGHRRPGSLYLACYDNRDEYTFHKQIQGLRPGLYKVSGWLRALDVKKGKWDVSIWIFADGGKGIQHQTKNLKGTFGWSRMTFTIKVTGSSLGLWFRLKSRGQLWVDDVKVQPHRGKPQPFRLARASASLPQPAPRGHGQRCMRCYRWWPTKRKHCPVCGGELKRVPTYGMFATKPAPVKSSRATRRAKAPVRLLLGFEARRASRERRFHSLRSFRSRATQGRRAAVIRYGSYINIAMGHPRFSNWSGYRILALDVYNPLQKHVPFHVCVNDKKQASYWDQLNHIARLAPGWNRLRFSLQQHVGERGSVRVKRYVDLAHIRRFWFAVAAEKKGHANADFLVDNVRLEVGAAPPQPFAGLLRFDFVTEPLRTQRGFLGVTTLQTYRPSIGFGFRNAKVWRRLDSQYADTLLRDAILTPRGEFVVDLPNGRYDVLLYARHLGLWYEHFWQRRTIRANGKVLVRERRTSARDYLRDRLRFQDVEPKPSGDAYKLYLRPLLQPYRATVRVTNKKLVLRWKGDASGIALNALIVAPAKKRKQTEAFVDQLTALQRAEFQRISRKLKPLARVEKGAISRADRRRGWSAALLRPSDYPRYNWVVRSRGKRIRLAGGWRQRPFQSLLVRSLKQAGTLRARVSRLRSSKGHTLPARFVTLRYGVNQFVGHEINHETYELAPRFLRPLPAKGLPLRPKESRLLWLQVQLDPAIQAGRYKGTLSLTLHGKTKRFPLAITVHPFVLPDVDMPVGYFGLDPVSFAYFDGKGVTAQKRTWRRAVLRELRVRGFSTWSSLPSARVTNQNGKLRADASEALRLLKSAQKMGFSQPIFTYGGSYLDSLLKIDQHDHVLDMPQATYRKKSAKVLRRLLQKHKSIPVIYTFTDEASGYSQKVKRDLRRARLLKTHYPFLRRGGFSHSIPKGKYGYKLNLTMTDISLSSVRREHVQALQAKGHRWGFYNAAIGPFEVGRSTFGEGLFSARLHGASHRLAWHMTGMQNYPYYDLDGRESDAMMLYPHTDGHLFAALKLEWAAQGLEDYRLLLLLRRLAKKAGPRGRSAMVWIAKRYRDVDFFSSPNYLRVAEERRTDAHSRSFRRAVIRRILPLLKAVPNK